MSKSGNEDSFNLQRFVSAQASVFEQVCSELRQGRKTGHWMWFIFPQLEGLGSSEMAKYYAISGLNEAVEYLRHPLLGRRLIECSRLVTLVEGRSIQDIFGYPDYLKFRSSMTLFAHAAPEERIFAAAVDKYFAGKFDPVTMDRLSKARSTYTTRH